MRSDLVRLWDYLFQYRTGGKAGFLNAVLIHYTQTAFRVEFLTVQQFRSTNCVSFP